MLWLKKFMLYLKTTLSLLFDKPLEKDLNEIAEDKKTSELTSPQ